MFFLGTIIALGALIFESLYSIIYSVINHGDISIVPALNIFIPFILIEEILKLGVIWKISQISKSKIFLNSIFIALGFSLTEVILNITDSLLFLNSFLFQYFGLFLIHTVTFAIFGFYFAKKIKPSRIGLTIVFLIATSFHLIYNLLVEYSIGIFPYYIFLFLLFTSLAITAFKSKKRFLAK